MSLPYGVPDVSGDGISVLYLSRVLYPGATVQIGESVVFPLGHCLPISSALVLAAIVLSRSGSCSRFLGLQHYVLRTVQPSPLPNREWSNTTAVRAE